VGPDSSDHIPRARYFRNRLDAGARLAERLDQYRGKDALVLGIPRGGVPVAAEVARCLDADLDIIVARKLGAPRQPELAMGAVTANGGRFLNEEIVQALAISQTYLNKAIAELMAEARRREERFRGAQPMGRVTDRIVIVVDDGLATGATMRAAVRSVRKQHPARLVVAVPVGSHEACAALRKEADELVCLYEPEPFWAVGLYYEQFAPTEDSEVQQLLEESYELRRRPKEPVG
jgi:putative phosphoribosyl transferase